MSKKLRLSAILGTFRYYASSIKNKDMDELMKLPDILNIDISTHCNLRCITCSLEEHYPQKSIMPMETFKKLADIFPKIKGVDLNCNAEPFFNKNIFEMIKFVKEISDDKTFIRSPTNGMMLTEKIMKNLIISGLDLIRFSFDGATPETFESIRVGAKLDKVIDNIKKFKRLKEELKRDNPSFAALYVAMKRNIHELPDFVRLASTLGIEEITVLGFEPYTKELADQVLYFDNIDYFKEAKEVALKVGVELNHPDLSLKSYSKCLFDTMCLISCEGDVIPCSACAYDRPFFIKDKRYRHKKVSFGNINEEPFMDIWNSPRFIDFRRRKMFGLLPEFCNHCLISHGVIVPRGGSSNEVLRKRRD